MAYSGVRNGQFILANHWQIFTGYCENSTAIPAFLLVIFLVYLIGSIPFGLILTKIFCKQDIRKIGSGNTGATNVLRTGNKKLAALTLFLDCGKGYLASVLTYAYYVPYLGYEKHFCGDARAYLALGLLAIIGHCYPVWLKFKGGKGVATALGALLAAVPYAGLAACATWLITAKITKISSLSALVAIAIAPLVTFFVYGSAPAVVCVLITLLVWWRHKENIKRLLNGTEPKIGAKKRETTLHPDESQDLKK
ncbi:MAG: glycerol-3-phosphate 1-O-acyltransferase PlsY [Alphaproteobacteria bacterium]|nr:glycerol-3-phosphate 1-O-acyltransferase PlsY [Alphaproteobacteria bacterium]